MTATGIRPLKLKTHRFSPEIRAGVAELQVSDNYHGILAWVEDLLWITGAITAPFLAERIHLFWLAYGVITFPVLAIRQRALATLLHESAHQTLARSPRLNHLLGTYFSGYWVLQSWSAYFHSHVVDHHGQFGNPDKDPDLRYHIGAGLYGTWTRGQFFRRFLLRPVAASQASEIARLVSSRLIYQRRPNWSELFRIVGFVGLLTTGALLAFGPLNILLFWYLPLFVGFPIINWYIELLEHFPFLAGATLDIEATRHRSIGPISRHFLGIHNEGHHLDHHLSPRVPFWNLPKVHALRMDDRAYSDRMSATHAGSGLRAQFTQLVRERPQVAPELFTRALADAKGNDAWLATLITLRINEKKV